MALAIQKQNEKCVDRKQPGPEEQRAFLAGPESGKLIEAGESAIAVLHHIDDGKIVGEEEIFQAADGDRHQDEDGHAGVARALGQQRASCDDACDSRHDRVHRGQESEQQCK